MSIRKSHSHARMSRRTLFVISLAIGAAAYGGLFVAAPHVILLRPNASAPAVLETFEVELQQRVLRPRYQTTSTPDLSEPRPNSVQELLDEELEGPVELPERSEALSPLPDMETRMTEEILDRQYALDEAAPQVSSIDAKILEISQEAARMDLDVPRRLVRESTERILEAGELPSLREAGEDRVRIAGGEGLPPLPIEVIAPEPTGDARTELLEPIEPEEDRPEFEEGVLNEEFIEAEGLPDLPIEMQMARAPIEEAIRRESSYEFMDDLVQIDLDTYVPPNERTGFFRVRVAPLEDTSMEVLPKDVTFVVDASKSILQRKLDLTTRGLEQCLALLRPEDRFNIVVFRDTPNAFRNGLTQATDSEKAAAREFIQKLESKGETDVYNGVRHVVESSTREGMASVVMVISDGRPTTGVVEARDIINTLTEFNTQRNSVYAFGGGNTVNRYLLDLLAYRNKGESRVARDMDDIDEDLPNFFTRLNDPVLVDLSADFGRIDDDELFPKELPDFYRGRVVEVFGRFDPARDADFVMRLQGLAGRGKKELVFKANLAEARTGDEAIARRWAFEKVYHLIGEICRVGEDPALLSELRELSRRYNIETSYTR